MAWNVCVKFFKLLIYQMSLLQIYQLPNAWVKDGITRTMEAKGNGFCLDLNGN